MNDTRTIGIYSYPKSGNTWVRQIIASVLEIKKEQLGEFIPDVHQQKILENPVSLNGRALFFYKSHTDAEIQGNSGRPVKNTHILHIRRNPLDVFLSYLNFISNNVTSDAPVKFSSVEDIANTPLFDAYFNAFTITGILQPNFKQAGNWFQSNKYWLSRQRSETQAPVVRSVRYEDLFHEPLETLRFLAGWLDISEDRIAHALHDADKRTEKDGKFFWRRKAKNFTEFLSRDQIDFFLRYRGKDCEELGYSAKDFLDD